jgi:hypothetical protein
MYGIFFDGNPKKKKSRERETKQGREHKHGNVKARKSGDLNDVHMD